ncbi:MAG: hypothetical protein QM784_31255 [Polyangiaceae bacterium]
MPRRRLDGARSSRRPRSSGVTKERNFEVPFVGWLDAIDAAPEELGNTRTISRDASLIDGATDASEAGREP